MIYRSISLFFPAKLLLLSSKLCSPPCLMSRLTKSSFSNTTPNSFHYHVNTRVVRTYSTTKNYYTICDGTTEECAVTSRKKCTSFRLKEKNNKTKKNSALPDPFQCERIFIITTTTTHQFPLLRQLL